MKVFQCLALPLFALPLAAQAWDVRLEVPFPKGQSLPQTLLRGTGELVQGTLDTGKGAILAVSHRIVRVGPVLKFEWGAEFTQWKADGQIQTGAGPQASSLKQTGLGVGVNAQFWVPFTGIAGELGLLERVQNYRYQGAGAARDQTLARPWLRVGLRWNLPIPGFRPYLAASYQEPITRDKPVRVNSAQDLGDYLNTQGAGQEFQRLWTFGVGVGF